MRKRTPSPLNGWKPWPVFLRFLCGLFFGILVAILVWGIIWYWASIKFREHSETLLCVMICLPLAWGIIAVFALRPLLAFSRRLLEAFCGESDRL